MNNIRPVYKGDDTAAHGNNFLNITIENPDLNKISKILVVINHGIITREFKDDNFFQRRETLLVVNLSSEETKKLNRTNEVNVINYDEQGLQNTCDESLIFYAKDGVIFDGKCKC